MRITLPGKDRILSLADCEILVQRATGTSTEDSPLSLEAIPLGLMLQRMLNNLKAIYLKAHDWPRSIRVLVDSLDAAGNVTSQQIAWVPGDLLGGSRLFFQVPAAPAPAYRVRVFSYDRIELDGNFR